MAPYFEIEKSNLDGYGVNYIKPGGEVTGKVDNKPVKLTVIDDESVDFERDEGSVVLDGKEGTFVFDSRGNFITRRQSGIVYLDPYEAERLAVLIIEFREYSPGALQDSLGSLWKRAEIDAGKRSPEPWTAGRIVNYLLSAGRTEDFTGNL